MSNVEAGKGEHHVYRILDPVPGDTAKLTAGNHYVGVDAVAWFINRESGWFESRMASGTLDIKLASETYQVALGTFELRDGARTAPVFEKPVLPDRSYLGGVLAFDASLTAIKKDTVIAGLLKSAADASLGVAAGMVSTATLVGPAALLGAAGSSIIGGVRTLLTDTGEKREPLFDFSGLKFTLRPDDMKGPSLYLLLHRGSELTEKDLKIEKQGHLHLPYYKHAPLDDGAWLLLRVRRSDEYSGVRDWFASAKAFRFRLDGLVGDVEAGLVAKDDALKDLQVSAGGDKTIQDEFVRLRGIVANDGVLAEREARLHISQLRTRIDAARRAISEGNKSVYQDVLANVSAALASGNTPPLPIARALLEEANSLATLRRSSIVADTPLGRVSSLDSTRVLESFKYLPDLLKEYSL